MCDDQLFCNGINAITGDYALPAVDPATFSRLVSEGEHEDAAVKRWLEIWHTQMQSRRFALVTGVDPRSLAQAGWGVIFPHDVDAAVREALSPLLEHRKSQVGGDWPKGRFRVFDGPDAYRARERSHEFLARHGIGPAPVDPARGVPYYLLIVGGPEHIPYDFQYLLDVQFAVGRIAFETAEEYKQYALSVIAAESGSTPAASVPRSCVFFAPSNDDAATRLTADILGTKLSEALFEAPEVHGWRPEPIVGAGATRERLAQVLRAEIPPALLFTAGHGMTFPDNHELQLAHQGALLGSAWSALRDRGKPVGSSLYFSADDINDETRLRGMIAFLFACYGAGTPQLDDFAHRALRRPVPIAPRDFVARLPQRMLGRKDGALAVVGHVERAWTHSFLWADNQPQLTVFKDVLVRLLTGHPVGSAMEPMNQRYAALSTILTQVLEDVKYGRRQAEELEIGRLWTAHHDARNYVVLGDPAVRLA